MHRESSPIYGFQMNFAVTTLNGHTWNKSLREFHYGIVVFCFLDSQIIFSYFSCNTYVHLHIYCWFIYNIRFVIWLSLKINWFAQFNKLILFCLISSNEPWKMHSGSRLHNNKFYSLFFFVFTVAAQELEAIIYIFG